MRSGMMLSSTVLLTVILGSASLRGSEESLSVFGLGERFFGDSLYNLAIEQYQKYLHLKRTPENDPTAHYKMALCHFRMGNDREAAEEFEEYVRLYPSETDVMDATYLAATSRRNLKEYAAASDLFYSVWSRFVGSVRARSALFEAAWSAEKGGNEERAVELYRLFVNRFEDQQRARQASLALARIHLSRKNYASAAEILESAERRWRNEPEVMVRLLYYKGLLAERTQKVRAAAESFAAMMKHESVSFPEREEAYAVYIEVLRTRREYAEALTVFRKLSEIYRRKFTRQKREFLLAWADVAGQAKSYATACDLYRKLLNEYADEINPHQVRYRLAEVLAAGGSFPEAVETLRRIESSDSSGEYSARAVLKIGDLYFGKELYPSAIAAYRCYLESRGRADKDRVLYRIGKIYQEKYHRYGAAAREFENLVKRYPSSSLHGRTLFSIAQCQEEIGEYRKALRNYEYLVEFGEDEELVTNARYRAAYINNFRIKNAEAAARELALLARADPAGVSASDRLLRTATVLERDLKDYTNALETYEEIERLDPGPADSILCLARLRRAHVFKRLSEKAAFEKDSATAAFAYEKARGLYGLVRDSAGGSAMAEEAAYSLMVIEEPNIAEYEEYIRRFPESRYLAEVFHGIATHYERRSSASHGRFSKKAIEAYREITRRFPSSKYAPDALIGLARHHLRSDELDSASRAVDDLLERFSGSSYEAEAYYIRGVLARKRNDNKVAADVFKQVLYRYPFSPFADRSRYELAAADLDNGSVFAALDNFRVYLQAHPSGSHALAARYGVARCLFLLNKRKEAVEMFGQLLREKLPAGILADVHRTLGDVADEKGDVSDALNHYKSVLSVESYRDKSPVLLSVGRLFFESGVYDEAAKAYSRALAFAKGTNDSVRTLTSYLTAMIMDGRNRKIDDAVRDFKNRYGGPHECMLAEVVYHQGLRLVVDKKYDKAINRYKYVMQKFTGCDRSDDAAYRIALCTYYQGKEKDALVQFQEFPVKYPASEFVPLAYFKMAMVFHGSNDFARAGEYFAKVVAHEKTDPDTRFRAANNAAVAFQKISSWLDAAGMYEVLLADFGERMRISTLHLKLGFCLIQASRIEDALRHFEKAGINPIEEEKPEVHYWIGACYARSGEYAKAITEYLKVPYLYSGAGKWGVTAEFEAARLYERQGEYPKAVTLYRKIVRSDGRQGRFGRKAAERIQRLDSLREDG